MASIARLSSKGQLVIPKSIRDAKGWEDGTELLLDDREDGVVITTAAAEDARFPRTTFDQLLALVPKVSDPPLTEEEIDAILLDEAGRRFDATCR